MLFHRYGQFFFWSIEDLMNIDLLIQYHWRWTMIAIGPNFYWNIFQIFWIFHINSLQFLGFDLDICWLKSLFPIILCFKRWFRFRCLLSILWFWFWLSWVNLLDHLFLNFHLLLWCWLLLLLLLFMYWLTFGIGFA